MWEKTASSSLLLSSLGVWSMDSYLRSPALSQVYLSFTFQLLQTVVVKIEMSSTFPTVPVKFPLRIPRVLDPRRIPGRGRTDPPGIS